MTDTPASMRSSPLHIRVNDQELDISRVSAHKTTLNFLREAGLTGVKEGCAEGECGACAVIVSRPDGTGTQWTAVNSCLIPVAALTDQEIYTSEGLADGGELHPVQHEMAMRGGSQCGYCTPGFIASMAAEYYRSERRPCAEICANKTCAGGTMQHPDAPPAQCGDDHELGANGFDLHALSGNLCRCTGYRPIRDAAYALSDVPKDDALARRSQLPAPSSTPFHLRHPDGDFIRPGNLSEALAGLAAQPEALLLAGGTDWGVEIAIKHRTSPLTIAVDQLDELRTFTDEGDYLEIGAALRLSEIEHLLDDRVPLLAELFPQFASRLIRNGATLGGNLGTGSPIGDCAPVLLALDASLVLTCETGERVIALSDYFTGYRSSVREPGELIRAIRIPTPVAPQARFFKIAKRRFDDISSVAVAISMRIEDNTMRDVRIGVGGVAATPVRASATEAALNGQPWARETFTSAGQIMASEGTPIDDHRASAAYRSQTAAQSLLRFFAEVTP